MQYNINENFLMHYGVIGMKWGQRKAKKFESRISQRNKDYESRKNAASKNRSKAKRYQRELNDLNKKRVR